MMINDWDTKKGVWTVNKTKGRSSEEIARMNIFEVPDEKTALHWAVDAGVITTSDLATALQAEIPPGTISVTWGVAQALLTKKVERE